MKKIQIKADIKKVKKEIVQLSEKELAGVAGGRRLIVYNNC